MADGVDAAVYREQTTLLESMPDAAPPQAHGQQLVARHDAVLGLRKAGDAVIDIP